MNWAKSRVMHLTVGVLGIGMLTCGKSGGGVGALLCQLATASYDTSALTVGLSQTFLDALRGQAATGLVAASDDEINEKLRSTINSALESLKLGDTLNVKAITSVPKDAIDDGIRFFQLEGKLAGAANLASTILRKPELQDALGSSANLIAGEKSLNYLEDSFRVRPSVTRELPSASSALFASDEFNQKQWAYSQTEFATAIKAAQALKNHKDEVIVAVIDTGVDLDHPALQDVLLKKDGKVVGYNFVNDTDSPDDDQGHGTHCAGIIAAQKKGDDGMIGVAEAVAPGKIKIMPIKVLGADGSGSTANINKGIRWAINHGADVISMSLGGAVDFNELQKGEGAESQIIRDAIDRGVIIVVAAGNENCPLGGTCEQKTLGFLANDIDRYTVLPCSYNGTLCVGASDPDVTVAEYSNYPSKDENGIDPKETSKERLRASPDIVAPGSAIYSTYPGGEYKVLSGTSMATPYVAGLAAIYKLKIIKDKESAAGTSQRSFWQLAQSSAAQLKEEASKTRSSVGQIDLAYFLAKLADLASGTTNAKEAPALRAVEGPEPGTDYEAPNLIGLMCSG